MVFLKLAHAMCQPLSSVISSSVPRKLGKWIGNINKLIERTSEISTRLGYRITGRLFKMSVSKQLLNSLTASSVWLLQDIGNYSLHGYRARLHWQDTRILGSANSQRTREAIEARSYSGEHSVNQFMQLLDPCYRSMRLQH